MQRLILICVLAMVAPLAAAEDAVTRLSDLLASARTVEAKFEQTVAGANGVVSQRASGVMAVARPHLFRWDVRQPFAQLIVADGRQVWVYDPDLAQAVVRPFDRQLADTPALLFSGDAKKIGERYTVTLLDEQAKNVRFQLKPHDTDALFEALTVGFRNGRLSDMALVDSLGQTTTIRFFDVAVNGSIPPTRFQFTPPAGVDVIREGN